MMVLSRLLPRPSARPKRRCWRRWGLRSTRGTAEGGGPALEPRTELCECAVQGAGPRHGLLPPRFVVLLVPHSSCDLELQDLLLSPHLLVHADVIVLQTRDIVLRYLRKQTRKRDTARRERVRKSCKKSMVRRACAGGTWKGKKVRTLACMP